MLRDRSGMALLLTLMAVSFLVAVTVQLNSSVSWQMQAAANQGNIVQLDAMLLSGLHLARAALLADQQENEYDSSFDQWGEFDTDAISALFPDGTLDIWVTDLSGHLQVNALILNEEEKKRLKREERVAKKKIQEKQAKKKDPEEMRRKVWQRFLLLAAELEEEKTADDLLDSLEDWLDEDAEERENGAETVYYRGLTPPYASADGPITLIEDLLLVKGWGKKILYGSEKKDSVFDENDQKNGIIEYLSDAGRDGKININTAPALVLQALHEEMTEEFAADLVNFRQEENNRDMLEQPDWYHEVTGFPGDIVFEQDLITTRSSYFKVTVTGEVGGLRRVGEGVVHRKENQEQILLRWKVE